MARIILVTGGCRSGKSEYAMSLGEAMSGPRAFVATCPPIDREMAERIRKHREARDPNLWRTVEEPLDLGGTLKNATDCRVLLVDCLTQWLANLIYTEEHECALTEQDAVLKCADLLKTCSEIDATVIFITDEVGMGIVPLNPSARLFRDLLGRINQKIAKAADQVTMVVCGMPLHLKKGTFI